MSRSGARLAAALVVAALLAGAALLPGALAPAAGARLRAWAAARGMEARWARVAARLPARVRFEGLVATAPGGDTLLAAGRLDVALSPWSVLLLRPRPVALELERAWIRLPARTAADPDTLAPGPAGAAAPRAERLRRAAEAAVRLLLTPARRLPRLALRDVTLRGGEGEDFWPDLALARLDLATRAGTARLAAAGSFRSGHPLPFAASLEHAPDDRLTGLLRVRLPAGEPGDASELAVRLDGAVTQDRARGRVEVHDTTRVQVGGLPLRVGGALERRGPRLAVWLAAEGVTEERFKSSLPPAVLGPLVDVGVRGGWDYRLALELDLARPDSVALEAEVVRHGLALDRGRTRLPLLELDRPFTATIHLPQGRRTSRTLSAENPLFRALPALAPHLVHAVVTNEDGSFFRHRGFNPEAVREAIAENLKAGAFRRGAGTITMQLARNLYLGHERSLARKFREVVLAWVLENLTPVSKERLLEVYLNVIEWGPGVHGAAEAAGFYFDCDPAEVGVAEALFLATVVPAPAKWRLRFDDAGALRPFARAQMHFIGRAMVAKGWLDPAALPAAESLHVELRGAAWSLLFPDSLPAVDTLGALRRVPRGAGETVDPRGAGG